MEPEIARRCPRCGASVRGGAFFCPQCGTPVRTAGSDGGVRSAAESVEKSGRRQTDGGNNSPMAAAAAPANETRAATSGAAAAAPRVAESERHPKRHRISSAHETVGEKRAPRMEKLRQASNVMLDEAAYDPSLRFVLVAVGIFLLTLLLFLLHGLIG